MNEITRTGWDVLDEARAMLRAAAAGVPADGWQRPTPCTEWNVAQVLQHAALDQGAWGAVISGTQPSGENPFAPSGDLGTEPLVYAEAALDASAPAWAAVSADGGPVPTPLPSGPMTARLRVPGRDGSEPGRDTRPVRYQNTFRTPAGDRPVPGAAAGCYAIWK